MTTSHMRGESCSIDGLVDTLCVRRGEVRGVLTALHREGMLDVLRMRLTLQGFAVGSSLQQAELAPLRLRAQPLAKTSRAA